jgi:hypothetical protein
MQVEIDVYGEYISFFRKVSSELGYDYLRFYIDGAEQNQWSGELDWSQESFPVTPGPHTFKWSYTKDLSVSAGRDRQILCIRPFKWSYTKDKYIKNRAFQNRGRL